MRRCLDGRQAACDHHAEHRDWRYDKHAGHENHGDMEKIKTNLAKLADEDRAAAEKQKDCPVTGEPLGSMGAPMKVNVKDRDVWICCGGCKDKLTNHPDEFLAKLKE